MLPDSVALISASVPVSVSAPVPPPEIDAPPDTVLNHSVPCCTASVTVMLPAAASGSEIEIPASTRSASSSTVCPPGTVTTGGSLTAATVIDTASLSVSGPPEPVLPLSFTATVSVSPPS